MSSGDRRGPQSLLVRNLSRRIRADELRDIFEKFGRVRDIYIPKDFSTGEPRGFAFVEFLDFRDARAAMDEMDRYRLDGRELTVVFAQERRKSAEEMRRRDGGYDDRRGPSSRDRRRYSRSRSRSPRRRSRSRSNDRRRQRSPSPRRRRSRTASRSRSRSPVGNKSPVGQERRSSSPAAVRPPAETNSSNRED